MIPTIEGESPRHRVRITNPFWLGMTPVTQEEYQQVVGRNPSEFSASGDLKLKVAGQVTRRFPVESVSWFDAVGFCDALSELPAEKDAKRHYRLPTEAEWEYACRARDHDEVLLRRRRVAARRVCVVRPE